MKKKNWPLVIIIFIAALLIAAVIWIYAKRIEHIESKMKDPTISVYEKTRYMRRHHAENDFRRSMNSAAIPLLTFGYNPDDGFLMIAGVRLTRQGYLLRLGTR